MATHAAIGAAARPPPTAAAVDRKRMSSRCQQITSWKADATLCSHGAAAWRDRAMRGDVNLLYTPDTKRYDTQHFGI
jgi:hypothetical protein